jgi:hypothetical protein
MESSMKATFHVIPIAAAPGLWSVLVHDANGNWFTWEQQLQGDHSTCIFTSRLQAIQHAERSAQNFFGQVTIHE